MLFWLTRRICWLWWSMNIATALHLALNLMESNAVECFWGSINSAEFKRPCWGTHCGTIPHSELATSLNLWSFYTWANSTCAPGENESPPSPNFWGGQERCQSLCKYLCWSNDKRVDQLCSLQYPSSPHLTWGIHLKIYPAAFACLLTLRIVKVFLLRNVNFMPLWIAI